MLSKWKKSKTKQNTQQNNRPHWNPHVQVYELWPLRMIWPLWPQMTQITFDPKKDIGAYAYVRAGCEWKSKFDHYEPNFDPIT